jgi:hypothetical protein
MQEKKQTVFKTPDITRMQEVVINPRTKIYIAVGLILKKQEAVTGQGKMLKARFF